MNFVYCWNKIIKKMRMSAIKNSSIHKTSKIESGSTVVNATMDRYSFCGYNCKLLNVKVGAFCSIADNVIIGGAQHPMEWVSTSPVFYAGRDSVKRKFSEFEREADNITLIGNDVWIGEGAFIKGGVTIGDGAIVGMGSVVTKDVEPYSIVAGNPAKLIRYRFSEDVVDELMKIKWWDFSDEQLLKYASKIKDPKEFIFEVMK